MKHSLPTGADPEGEPPTKTSPNYSAVKVVLWLLNVNSCVEYREGCCLSAVGTNTDLQMLMDERITMKDRGTLHRLLTSVLTELVFFSWITMTQRRLQLG